MTIEEEATAFARAFLIREHPERVTSLVLLLELAGETEQRAFTAKLPDLEIEEMPASSEGRLFNFSGLLRPVAEG